MESYGFMKVAVAAPELRVADVAFNVERIKEAAESAAENGANILLTPEMSLCGYTCEDLFLQEVLQRACLEGLSDLAEYTARFDMPLVVGLPLMTGDALYNAAVLLYRGSPRGAVPKTYIANYAEYYEKRRFSSGRGAPEEVTLSGETVPFGSLLFRLNGLCTVGIEICEDLWVPVPPSCELALAGANLILNPSASSEQVAKNDYRRELVKTESARLLSAYAYAGAGAGESTTDLVFSGASFIAENGEILAEGERFSTGTVVTYADVDFAKLRYERSRDVSFADCREKTAPRCRTVDLGDVPALDPARFGRSYSRYPFVPSDPGVREERCGEILKIQSAGLAKRLSHTGQSRLAVGVSGGLDSALALLVAVMAVKRLSLPAENVIAVTMPGFGTSERTHSNAFRLARALGVTAREVPITRAAAEHLRDIGHDGRRDVTYENAQARERTQVLMDIANMEGALLVGTGDLSEAALGWSTYNGDHMSMYGVNAGVPKTLVRYLVEYAAGKLGGEAEAALRDILATPVSPELLPPDKAGSISQKTEETIGPYALHDFFLYHFARYAAPPEKLLFLAERTFAGVYSPEEIKRCLELFIKRFFGNQFKRSCTPDAPKVGSVALSPRGDWRCPSDACCSVWTEALKDDR